jgi:hypothetical protein
LANDKPNTPATRKALTPNLGNPIATAAFGAATSLLTPMLGSIDANIQADTATVENDEAGIQGKIADLLGAQTDWAQKNAQYEAAQREAQLKALETKDSAYLNQIKFLREHLPIEKIAPPPPYVAPPDVPIPQRPVPRPSALGSLFAAIAGIAAPESAGAIAASNIKGAIDSAAQTYQDALTKRQLELADMLRRWESIKEHLQQLQAYDQARYGAEHARDLARLDLDKLSAQIESDLAGVKEADKATGNLSIKAQAAAVAKGHVDAIQAELKLLPTLINTHAAKLRNDQQMKGQLIGTLLKALTGVAGSSMRIEEAKWMAGQKEQSQRENMYLREALQEKLEQFKTGQYIERARYRYDRMDQRELARTQRQLELQGVKDAKGATTKLASYMNNIAGKAINSVFDVYWIANDDKLAENDQDKKQAKEALPRAWARVSLATQGLGPAAVAAVGRANAPKFILAGVGHIASVLDTAGIPQEQWAPRIINALDALAKLGYVPQAEVERIRANPALLLMNQIPPANQVDEPTSVPVQKPLPRHIPHRAPTKVVPKNPAKQTKRPTRAPAPTAKEDPRDIGIMRGYEGR